MTRPAEAFNAAIALEVALKLEPLATELFATARRYCVNPSGPYLGQMAVFGGVVSRFRDQQNQIFGMDDGFDGWLSRKTVLEMRLVIAAMIAMEDKTEAVMIQRFVRLTRAARDYVGE